MMNIINAVSLILLAIMNMMAVESFIPPIGCPRRLSTSLGMAKSFDITDVIKSAAWRQIEEIEYDENRIDITDGISQFNATLGVEQYEEMLHELKPLLEKQVSKTEKLKSIATEIKASLSMLC